MIERLTRPYQEQNPGERTAQQQRAQDQNAGQPKRPQQYIREACRIFLRREVHDDGRLLSEEHGHESG